MSENKLNLSTALKQVMLEDLLGKVIDLTRMSDMGDRQHRQFVITIKKEFFEKLELLNNLFVKADTFDVTPTEEIVNRLRTKKDDTHN
jgi:hypothetical protein